MFREFIERRQVKFKGLEGDCLICDIEWAKPKRVKRIMEVDGNQVFKTVTERLISKNARIKLDINNHKLLEKIKSLKKNKKIYIEARIPANIDRQDTVKWELQNILDEIDLLELSNKNCLIQCEIPSRDELKEKNASYKPKKKSKKDIKIAELEEKAIKLEEENSQLKLQFQLLQKQLQDVTKTLINFINKIGAF